MREASFFSQLSENAVRCELCPHNCIIKDGFRGICGVRINKSGKLFSEVYGRPVAIQTDPIEKKPLYHFYPGSQILSIGTMGCNLKCSFCQNCEISQIGAENQSFGYPRTINEIILMAKEKQKNIGLAYTYNEPIIYYEYMTDLAFEIHKIGMKNVMVSNGFINPEPLSRLLNIIDAFNIDLKSFSNDFYRKNTGSSLDPVLNTIKMIHDRGRHLELTFLVIPGLNDDAEVFDEMINWIVTNTGKKTVFHISRYFPHYKMNTPPTPYKTLERLFFKAKEKLDFVYLGNVAEAGSHDTICPVCNALLIKRNGYYSKIEGLDNQGRCAGCKEEIINFSDK